ncbi:ATP-grasp domain-containing protein [Gemmata sp. JC717]|uniref:ATP-grasp domain-containing protein n=1 Tax=Gemmata algarum TaxID=2975278 RepID=UPI0021BB829A|nr:ATP-grasp domain-containing protein [Gemmata algarum]MDY3552126.1 ATP-grasp domain-containing protein [Gemmata algarum]
MRVFVYEYMTALGIGREPGTSEHGMYLEGRAMRDALLADFGRIEAVEVLALPDDAAPVESDGFEDSCNGAVADWTVVVAPETDEILFRYARKVEGEPRSGRLLGCSPGAIGLTSDKLALAEHWRAHGIRTPATSEREPTPCEAFPVVWKPRDGAGSTDTFLIRDRFELASALAGREAGRPMILQEFVSGTPASVAFLCGPRAQVDLLPATQRLSTDGRFKYGGGELPVTPELASRAVTLARAAVACVPGLLGYVGVDLVLGNEADGSSDFVIEINPRLTTSYIGLRVLADFNMAEAMLAVASGREIGPLKWKPGRVRFGADGSVTTPC